MAEGFRRTMSGWLVARMDAPLERGVLASMLTELLDIVVAPGVEGGLHLFAVEMGLEDLDMSVDVAAMGMLDERDPVTSRLFPDAYPEDEQAAMDFRRFTELSLRQQKNANATTVLACLERSGDKVTITRDEALAWLTALNDCVSSLAVRSASRTRPTTRRSWTSLQDDQRYAGYQIYDFLTWLQDSLVRVLSE